MVFMLMLMLQSGDRGAAGQRHKVRTEDVRKRDVSLAVSLGSGGKNALPVPASARRHLDSSAGGLVHRQRRPDELLDLEQRWLILLAVDHVCEADVLMARRRRRHGAVLAGLHSHTNPPHLRDELGRRPLNSEFHP